MFYSDAGDTTQEPDEAQDFPHSRTSDVRTTINPLAKNVNFVLTSESSNQSLTGMIVFCILSTNVTKIMGVALCVAWFYLLLFCGL